MRWWTGTGVVVALAPRSEERLLVCETSRPWHQWCWRRSAMASRAAKQRRRMAPPCGVRDRRVSVRGR
jgi:hypothetical protein